VALVTWGWWWYATNGQAVLGFAHGPKSFLLMAVLYIGPLVVGAILVVFMFKPILVRAPKTARPMSVDERQERFLFAFIRRVCAAVGAPEPRRIDITCEVNASASFRRGALSLLGNDLVLTIGLPLVAGQNLRQFTGVLAHEFGHFAQGWAMRASFLIRSVNLWFARVVYQRDALDEWLQDQAEDEDSHWAITAVMYVTAFFVWVTRGVLFLLMMLGHALSSLLSRHMEFDADRHAFRLVGREPFATALRELPLLGAAEELAREGLAEAWKSQRLVDDFPRLVATGVTLMPSDMRAQVIDAGLRHAGGMYASHPATRDRIQAAEREPDTGVFTGAELPAQVLFNDFPALCRAVTLAWYRDEIGLEVQPANLIATTDLTRSGEHEAATAQQVERFLGRLWSGTTLFSPSGVPTPVRDQNGLIKDAESVDEAIIEEKRRQALIAAGINQARDQGNSLSAAQQRRVLVRTRIARAAAAMKVKLDAAQGPEADLLRSCLNHLAGMQAAVDEVREGFLVLVALLQHLEFHGEEPAFRQALIQESQRQQERLASLQAAGAALPSISPDQEAPVMAANLPAPSDLPAIMQTSEQALESCFSRHQQALGRLVALVLDGARSPSTAVSAAGDPPALAGRIPAGVAR
jgi:Zn-dependent protease with chaperone function